MRKRRRITQADLYKAKKKLFVAAILRDNNIRQAATKCGFSLAEAKAFHQSIEYAQMSNFLWSKYVNKSLEEGSKSLFSSVVAALSSLKDMVDSSNTDTKIRAIGELRQWLNSSEKSSIVAKMTSKILETGEAEDKDEETYTPETSRRAMAFLDSYRKTGNGRRSNGRVPE